MISISIRELRQHDSRHVRMAKAGRRVAITERGAPVAYLVPAEEPASVLARLEAAGDYLPPVGSVLDLLPPPPAPPGKRPLSEVVQELSRAGAGMTYTAPGPAGQLLCRCRQGLPCSRKQFTRTMRWT